MMTITDVHAAVVDLRPDADAAGVEIAEHHVRRAMGPVRYDDVDHEMLLVIADRAVEIALDDLRSLQIDQVGRRIAEACLDQGGWLEAAQERSWSPDDWEWTSGDYDYAQEVLGDMPLEEVQAVRAAVVARLQEAVDAAPSPRKRYRVQVAVKGGGCDAIVAGLAEALRVAELCGAPWWIECDDQYFLYQTEEAMDAGSLEVGVVEKVTR